jgi:hypothetical protein
MSSHAEIAEVHKAETDFRLKPHLSRLRETIRVKRETGPLRVTLEELLSPETVERLREMRLL